MPNTKLTITISEMDSQMRNKARLLCGDRVLGDDIWHDAVLKLLTSYAEREVEDTNIPGLLYSALYSCFMDAKRKDGTTARCVELKHAEQEIVDNGYSVYGKLAIGEIVAYLDHFNRKHRDIFLMSVFGMDNASIAIVLDEKQENVRKVIFRVRAKIKKEFKNARSNF
jgi:DNA-directed RNA polymerase specialized sigma24 family protein